MGWHTHLEEMHMELREFPDREDDIGDLMFRFEVMTNAKIASWKAHKKRKSKY